MGHPLDPSWGFGPAAPGEPTVFGARRPGFPLPLVPAELVHRWIAFMQAQGIARLLCLLPSAQLRPYRSLLPLYEQAFGAENCCWSPITDFTLATPEQLTGSILPFLAESERRQQRVVVHCSAGIGRTGHVLAAWLVSARGMTNEQAIEAVRQGGRNPREARDAALDALLDQCRAASRPAPPPS